jgi:hypothetical protein
MWTGPEPGEAMATLRLGPRPTAVIPLAYLEARKAMPRG